MHPPYMHAADAALVDLFAAMRGELPPNRLCHDAEELAFWFVCAELALSVRRQQANHVALLVAEDRRAPEGEEDRAKVVTGYPFPYGCGNLLREGPRAYGCNKERGHDGPCGTLTEAEKEAPPAETKP